MIKIFLKQNKRGKWFLILRARNGQCWSCGEEYASKSNAIRGGKNMSGQRLVFQFPRFFKVEER
jgi:uncharacterized protein YegP (UPF0339 family)